MNVKILSKKLSRKLLRLGTTASVSVLAMLLSNNLSAQTIFSNPVGINVGSVAAGKDFHVNGPIRFNDLAGTGTRVVTCDPNGDLGFTTISGTLPSGTSIGQTLIWDGSNWVNNDFLKVPNFTGAPRIFDIGITEPIDFVRTIHYGGNVALDLQPGTLGTPTGVWMSQGWRTVNNSAPAGENFMGTRINWQDYAGSIGLSDRTGGAPERDLNIQLRDYTVPVGDPLTNRIIFSGEAGPPGGGAVDEWATILGNGFMGVGTPTPFVKFQVQDGNMAQVSQGILGPPAAGNRWNAVGDRVPFTGPPGIISTGLRSQWDEFAANFGLTEDAVTGTRAGLISWQDVNGFGTGDNPLIFGARDATNTDFFERMRITWDGNVGIGTDNPLIKLQVRDGNIGQSSAGNFGLIGPGNRWTAIGGRIPFGPNNPFIRQEGTRTQWDNYGVGLGLTDDIGGSTIIKDAILSFQDANANYTAGTPVFSQNKFILGARDGVGGGGVSPANFRPYMVVTGDEGNVGFGDSYFNPIDKVAIRGGSNLGVAALNVQDNGFNSLMYVRNDGFVGINTTLALFPTGPFTALAGGGGPGFGNVRLSVRGDITQLNGDFTTAGDVYAASDARFKKDFSELKNTADWKRILNVKAYSYKFDNDMVDNMEFDERTHYGFKAQDVNAEIPELTKKWGEAFAVNYQGFIPFLTAGMQEHEERLQAVEENTGAAAVESLQAGMDKMAKENEELRKENQAVLSRLQKLEDQLAGICNLPCVQEAINQNTQEGTLNDQPQLFQNEPNPFGSSTTIKYYVPANASGAAIKVVDNSGKQLGEYQLRTGKGQLEISAGTIPAGTYNYTLYVDGQVVDTKKMVIVNY